MSLKSTLGFGMMRLPVINGNPTDFDYEQLNTMVDTYLEAGYHYFDTSYVYHNGKSEEAVKKSVVERHPRDSFTVATKFPTFLLKPGDEDKIEGYFQEQLDRLGVDYIDYYLLHNFQTRWYDGYDGKGGVIQSEHLIEHALKWKEEGKIRHLGFSFHSSAKLLDRILTEHPEFEFVQIAANYVDWNSELVQAGPCYDVIRKHGKQVVIMEPVKGGGLASVPEAVEKTLKEKASKEPYMTVREYPMYGNTITFYSFTEDLTIFTVMSSNIPIWISCSMISTVNTMRKNKTCFSEFSSGIIRPSSADWQNSMIIGIICTW